MKKKINSRSWKASLINNKEADEKFLSHFLSPIELAASKADFKHFTYYLENLPFEITAELSNELLQASYRHLRFFQEFIIKIQKNRLFAQPEYSEFLNAPLKSHNLSTRLFHCLRGNNCETMLDVLNLGRKGFSRIRGIGPNSIKEIDKILTKRGCIELFK